LLFPFIKVITSLLLVLLYLRTYQGFLKKKVTFRFLKDTIFIGEDGRI